MPELPRDTLFLLLELTQRLSQDAPLEDHLQAVTDIALRLLPCDHASIRVVDASGVELLSSARSGVGTIHRAMRMKRGTGVAGWVLQHGRPVSVPDTRDDERFHYDPHQGFGVLSLIGVPLLYGGHVIGVFNVSASEPNAFSTDDELIARLLANCSVPALERARLARLAVTDDLTLAFNARYLEIFSTEELARARRDGDALSVAMLDLDHFKNVNDTYGHASGDRVLRAFADRVRDNTRRSDIFIRKGGEEFLLILPVTPAARAHALLERVRQSIETSPFPIQDGREIEQTVSIGVATWDGREGWPELLHRADGAMYEAKRGGRNQVVIAEHK